MVPRTSAPIAAVLLFYATGCTGPPAPRSALDPSLAACIPPDSALIAGIDAATVRTSPLYSSLPAGVRALAVQFDGITSALAAYNGKDLLVAARGRFPSPAPGAAMLAPDLALFGSPLQIAAATAQYHLGRAEAHAFQTPALLAQAESVAAGAPVWVAALGNAPLPLTGNAANLTQILRQASFVTFTARTAAGLALELRVSAPDSSAARTIEETLRADLTLAAAGEAKQADVAAALRAAQVTRTGSEVRVTLAVDDTVAARLLALF